MEQLLELEELELLMWKSVAEELDLSAFKEEDERDYYRQVEMETKEEYERDAEW